MWCGVYTHYMRIEARAYLGEGEGGREDGCRRGGGGYTKPEVVLTLTQFDLIGATIPNFWVSLT